MAYKNKEDQMAYRKQYYQLHKEHDKVYQQEHRAEKTAYLKQWHIDNPYYNKEYRLKNKEKLSESERHRWKNDKEREQERNKIYYQNNGEKLRAKKRQSYQENIEYEKARHKKYNIEHPDYQKEYDKTHPEQRRERLRKYYKTQKGIVNRKRKLAKHRRELGYLVINSQCAKGNAGHHLDKINVIYIPEELHKSISHNVYTGKNMDIINLSAWDYLEASVL